MTIGFKAADLQNILKKSLVTNISKYLFKYIIIVVRNLKKKLHML